MRHRSRNGARPRPPKRSRNGKLQQQKQLTNELMYEPERERLTLKLAVARFSRGAEYSSGAGIPDPPAQGDHQYSLKQRCWVPADEYDDTEGELNEMYVRPESEPLPCLAA